ncbi:MULTISPECIES: phosphatase PAP2 family protein [unclassified Massilia]|uniref:phosphatase PAP2 family protein n=1 Tax=unclassified Massilia TaxID=2609279 RepID=UPI0012E2965C|nr:MULTISPECIES: phosphatase PAP2 family protein [unclassified Massilia]
MPIIDIGHTAVMLPAAGAIAVWLVSGRAWKLAMWWCLIFSAGLGLVALSKIGFLGWGLEIPALRFKALSGHAWRATAVIPVLFFVLLQRAPLRWRRVGVVLGMALSLGICALLVIFRFHTVSEVVASAVLGFAAGFTFIRISAILPALQIRSWAAPASVLAFALICGLKPSSINHRLVDVALFLSGRDHPYRWSRQVQVTMCAAHPPAAPALP